MTDGTAGWFRDPTDPSLARWHDGQRWTEHTLVIADQAPGSEPPPPTPTPAASPTPSAFGATSTFETGGYTDTQGDQGLAGRVRALPTWGKVAAPLVVVLVLVLAFMVASGGDSDGDKTETAGTASATLDDAVDAARSAGLSDEISDARAAALIGRICNAATRPSDVDDLGQDLGELPAATTSALRREIRALGVGAEERCADDLDAEPGLIDDLQDAALDAYSTTTTAVTLLPDGSTDAGTDSGVDGGTDSGTTGTTKAGSKTTTTKKGTATTAAPTTTTTKAVPKALPNQPCSSEGAVGENKITGAPMSCQRPCSGGTKLTWRQGTCPTNPTTPPTQPGQTIPTNTTTSTP